MPNEEENRELAVEVELEQSAKDGEKARNSSSTEERFDGGQQQSSITK